MLALSCLLALVLSGCSSGSRLRFGAAGQGGAYDRFAAAFVDACGDGFTFDIKNTAGSAANLRLLEQDYLQLALAQTDLIRDAAAGEGFFAETGPCEKLWAVAGLYPEACQIVVRADSEITQVTDLAGRRVSIGEEESGTAQNARQILQGCGLSEQMLEVCYLSYAEAAQQLQSGEIDAFFCTEAAPVDVVAELGQDVRLLGLDADMVQRMVETYGYLSVTIPAGTYAGQTEPVTALGVKAVLLASADVPDETIRTLTQRLFESGEALQQVVPLQLDPAQAVEDIPIAFHPGAVAYYADLGLDVETEA